MRILVYGAGVIGSYLAHVLCAAGNDVSIAARGERKNTLEKNGLVIHHYLQKNTTVDHPRVVEIPENGVSYDAVFAVMQNQQMWNILDFLADADAQIIILVGNNMYAAEMENQILSNSKTPKTVLFGFQGTAGQRENDSINCVRFGAGSMSLGGLHNSVNNEIKQKIISMFNNTKYNLTWEDDMDGWYKTHLTLILPVAYVCYTVDCDLHRTARQQRKLALDAAGEACALLQHLNIPVLPKGDELYYQAGAKRKLMEAMLYFMAKTKVGELAASDHCRHAVTEMESLDLAFQSMRQEKAPDFLMPAFDTLRRAMPEWPQLHNKFDIKS